MTFILNSNFDNPTEGILENTNGLLTPSAITTKTYDDSFVSSDNWSLVGTNNFNIPGLQQQASSGASQAQFLLPLVSYFDFQIELDTTLLGEGNKSYVRLFLDNTFFLDIGIEASSTQRILYRDNVKVHNSPVFSNTVLLRFFKYERNIYAYYFDGLSWICLTSEWLTWLSSPDIKFALITESDTNPAESVWKDLTWSNSITYSTPLIWRSKVIGDNLELPAIPENDHRLIRWGSIEVDSIPTHGALYFQYYLGLSTPSYTPNITFPIFSGPLLKFERQNSGTGVLDLEPYNLESKYLLFRLIAVSEALPYRDLRDYVQYEYVTTSITTPAFLTLDYVPIGRECKISEQGLDLSFATEVSFDDTNSLRVTSEVNQELPGNTHYQIRYRIPAI